jgi:hypothetical protein
MLADIGPPRILWRLATFRRKNTGLKPLTQKGLKTKKTARSDISGGRTTPSLIGGIAVQFFMKKALDASRWYLYHHF